MAKDNFAACHAITARWEGGDVNHPKDPGGLTSRGVTAARGAAYRTARGLRKKVVTAWTDREVLDFYNSEFWALLGCERLAAGVDLAVYDAGVNSGPARARKWLAAVPDGPARDIVVSLCARRLSFVRGLKTWTTFGRGWARRIADIEARAVAMTLKAAGARTPRRDLEQAANDAAATARTQSRTAAGSGVGGIGAVLTPEGLLNLPLWQMGVLAVVCVGLAVWLALKARNNRARAEAYRLVAGEVGG